MGVSKNTIKRYLRDAPAGVGKPRGVAGASVRDAVQPRALELLEDSKRWTAGKQRLTAARLYTMLSSEGFDVGYTVVKDIVREWNRQRKEVFVLLVYKPGDSAQVRRQVGPARDGVGAERSDEGEGRRGHRDVLDGEARARSAERSLEQTIRCS